MEREIPLPVARHGCVREQLGEFLEAVRFNARTNGGVQRRAAGGVCGRESGREGDESVEERGGGVREAGLVEEEGDRRGFGIAEICPEKRCEQGPAVSVLKEGGNLVLECSGGIRWGLCVASRRRSARRMRER